MFDAREYLRVSDDKSGTARSTTEQHAENQEAADERSWTLGEPYRDNDRSASKFARKAREDFGRLVADLEAGRFGAQYLIIWEASRGGREMEEWVRLIKLCERQRVKFYITSDDRVLDPANDGDWGQLMNLGQASEAESRKTSKRVKRATKASAAQGRPHGRAPYGYRRTYGPHPTTGKQVLTGQVPEPHEAAVIAELFDRLVKGHTLRGIAMDFEARGITRKDGLPFSQQHLRNLATTHSYVGKRVYIAGRDTPNARPAELVDAMWPAIVEQDVWHSVQRILGDPSRVTRRPGGAKHLLALIARCDPCGGFVTVLLPGGTGKNLRLRSVYRCQTKGCVKVDQEELDTFATNAILGYLTRDGVYESLAVADDNDQDELQAVRDRLAEARRELDELADAVGRGLMSAVMAGRAEVGIVERVTALEGREVDLSTPSVLRGLIQPGADVQGWWEGAEISTQREVARLLLTPDRIGELRIMRADGRRGRPVAERVGLARVTESL